MEAGDPPPQPPLLSRGAPCPRRVSQLLRERPPSHWSRGTMRLRALRMSSEATCSPAPCMQIPTPGFLDKPAEVTPAGMHVTPAGAEPWSAAGSPRTCSHGRGMEKLWLRSEPRGRARRRPRAPGVPGLRPPSRARGSSRGLSGRSCRVPGFSRVASECPLRVPCAGAELRPGLRGPSREVHEPLTARNVG